MSQLEIWCKIYFWHSLVIVFPGRKLLGLPQLPMEHPLTQTGLLAYPKVVLHRLPRSQTVRQCASANAQFRYVSAPPDAAPGRASWLNIPFASGPRLEMACLKIRMLQRARA